MRVGSVAAFVLALLWGGASAAGAAETSTTAVTPEATTSPPTTAPPETVGGPTERDPAWRASVVLGCGSGTDTRIVESFQASIDPDQAANLLLATPQSGGTAYSPLGVGGEIAVDAQLDWNIQGVFLGPWPVDSVEDTCEAGAGQTADDRLPETGRGLLFVALVGVGLAGTGLVVLGAGGRTSHP